MTVLHVIKNNDIVTEKFLFNDYLVLLNDILGGFKIKRLKQGGFKLLNDYSKMVSAIKRLYSNCINYVLPCHLKTLGLIQWIKPFFVLLYGFEYPMY